MVNGIQESWKSRLRKGIADLLLLALEDYTTARYPERVLRFEKQLFYSLLSSFSYLASSEQNRQEPDTTGAAVFLECNKLPVRKSKYPVTHSRLDGRGDNTKKHNLAFSALPLTPS